MDDTAEFEKNKFENCQNLRTDKKALKLCRELLHLLDDHRYSYLWSSGGLPIIQTPADIVAQQELIWLTKPNVIIETGVARGGSLINSAMSLELNGGRGIVIGIDIDIRSHNRINIEKHKFSNRVQLVQGSSVDPNTLAQVKKFIEPSDRVMVILDSNHTYSHVFSELKLWADLVSKDCYLIVADTMLFYATKVVKGSVEWISGDDPLSALNEFFKTSRKFEVDEVMNGKLIFSSSFGGYMRAVL